MQPEIIIAIAVAIGVIGFLLIRNSKTTPAENNALVDSLNQTITDLKTEKDDLNRTITSQNDQITQLRTDLAVAQTNVKNTQALENTYKEQAQVALNQSARTLSQQLLDDFKKESQQTTQSNQKLFSETNEKLINDFKAVSEKVKSLNDNVESTNKTVNTIENALSNPHSIGQESELILENILKSYGLTAERDYTTQSSIKGEQGNTLRPDATVFLPNNSVLAIDSKASKFTMDMARSDTEEDYQKALKSFTDIMRSQLKSLTRKDYRPAVKKHYQADDVIMVMWLATDGLLAILQQHAPDIFEEALKSKIFITGPSGLRTTIGIASQKIALQQQNKNQEQIVLMVEKLLQSIGTVVKHAEAMGRGLKSANTAFESMRKSFNGTLLPRSRNLEKLGVTGPTTNKIPERMKGITNDDDIDIIDGEIQNPSQIEPPKT